MKGYQNCKFHEHRIRGSCARAWPYTVDVPFTTGSYYREFAILVQFGGMKLRLIFS